MSLLDTFQGIPETIFNVFSSLTLSGKLIMTSDVDGWDDTPSNPDNYDLDVIISNFRRVDVERTSFYNLIQVNDVIALVKGSQITVPLDTADSMQIIDRLGTTKKYSIVAFDVDPAGALYIILLRAS